MLLAAAIETVAEYDEVLEELEAIFSCLHHCQELTQLLECGVQQTRYLFGSDRALIYQFIDQGDGAVTAEAISDEWTPVLGQLIYDPCFENQWGERFQQGAITAIENVDQANVDPCYRQLLQQLQVKANLVSPILVQPFSTARSRVLPTLWGLLIIHQCDAPRLWQKIHRQVAKQIATQMGWAIRRLQQHQVLAASRWQERQWQTAIETAECGMWHWRSDVDEVSYSLHWRALLGYPAPQRGETLSDSLAIVHPDDQARVRAALQQHISQQTPVYDCEYRLVCGDGRWKWVCSRGRITERRPDGSPLHFVGLIWDISDRKQHETELQQQAEREHALNEVIEAIRSSLNIQDIFDIAANQIARCLQGRVRVSQYRADERIWQAVAVNGGPFDWSSEQMAEVWAGVPDVDNPVAARLKELETVIFEDVEMIEPTDQVNRHLAEQFPGQWLIVPIVMYSEVWGAVSLTRPHPQSWHPAEIELTRRIAAQLAIAIHHANLHQQAQAASERNALVLNSINEGIWDWRSGTDRIQFSTRYWQILGVPPLSSRMSRLSTELERIHPDDLERFVIAIYNHLATPSQFEYELRLRSFSGAYVWVRLRGKAVWDDAGNLVRMLGSVEDISDRKFLEMRLRRQEKDFRTLVENNPDGVMRVDRQLSILYANPIMESCIGAPPLPLIGKRLGELNISTELFQQWQSAITQVFATGQEQLLETQAIVAETEQVFYSRLVPEYTATDQMASVLIISRNVTNLRAAQIALQRQIDQEHTLRLMTQDIRATLDIDQILATTVAEVQRMLQADRTLIVRFVTERSRRAVAEAVRPGYLAIVDTTWEAQALSSFWAAFYARGQGRIELNVSTDSHDADLANFLQRIGVKSQMLAPIIQTEAENNEIWGMLVTHACRDYRHWQLDQLHLLQKVAEQVAIAIQQSILHQRLQAANEELARISVTDGLTQIANRRHFDDILEKEWRRAVREQQEVTLIFCDIDHFKYFNDQYGHPAGDECIVAVAQALQGCVNRATDCLARYGGEEFAVVLPQTDVAGATVIVQQMQAAIAAIGLEHKISGIDTQITLSYGIASVLPQPHILARTLVEQADQALYQAKQAGRDRYAVFKPSV
ncbi:MAG: diguanylate cyclase domain-containing protein [Leptolyngbyaceae cyanobacterium]